MNNYATMHIVTNSDACEVKKKIREELLEHGICHATLETETEACDERQCHIKIDPDEIHHHHHHH